MSYFYPKNKIKL